MLFIGSLFLSIIAYQLMVKHFNKNKAFSFLIAFVVLFVPALIHGLLLSDEEKIALKADSDKKEQEKRAADEAKKKRDASIAGISKNIESVSAEDTKDMTITLSPKDSWSENTFVREAAMDMSIILHEIVNKKPQTYNTITFITKSKLVDNYGKESYGELFAVMYNMPEVEKVNFDNVRDVQLMNNFTVGTVGSSPAGKKALANFCLPENSLKDAANFCLRAFSK